MTLKIIDRVVDPLYFQRLKRFQSLVDACYDLKSAGSTQRKI